MKLCFECCEPAEELHHVVPKSLGGTRTIPLCCRCHGKVHASRRVSMSELIIQGLQRAKRMGKRIGPPPKYEQPIIDLIKNLHGKKIAIREIGRRLDIPYTSVREIIAREICKSSR